MNVIIQGKPIEDKLITRNLKGRIGRNKNKNEQVHGIYGYGARNEE